MALLDNANLAQETNFKKRVKMAMVAAAKNVAAETQTEFIRYQKRHSYASMILNNPDSKISAFADAVAANPAISSASTDSDIEFTVNSVFDAMAGVKPSDAGTK